MSAMRSAPKVFLVVAAVGCVVAACGTDRTSFVDLPDAAPPPVSFSEGGVDAPSEPVLPPAPVDVIITADNAYSFGWGDENSVSTYYEVAPAMTAGQIFDCPIGNGPEAYVVPADEALPGAWLYIIGWADFETTQGVIGQFKHRGGEPTYTGAGEWQGCATGRAYSDNLRRPDQSTVNEEIAKCNAASGDPKKTSAGWVGPEKAISPNAQGRVVFGQDNESDVDLRGKAPGYAFPPVCKRDITHDNQGIDGKARWMWYAPPDIVGDPFFATGQNDTRTFIIFRLPTKAVPPPIPPK